MKRFPIVLSVAVISMLILSAFSLNPVSAAWLETTVTPNAGDSSGNTGNLSDGWTQGSTTYADPSRLSQLMGYEVRDQKDQVIGALSGFVLDPERGRIQYLIVNDDNGESVLVPRSLFDLNQSNQPDDDPNTPVGGRAFYLQVDPGLVAAAPRVDVASLGGEEDTWSEGQQAFWSGGGGIPVTGGEGQQTLDLGRFTVDSRNLMITNPVVVGSPSDIHITGLNGETIGQVVDIIVSRNDELSTIQYVLVQADQSLGIGDCVVPVPWTALNWNDEDMGAATGSDASGTTGGDEAQMTPTVETGGDASGATGGDEAEMTPTVEAGGDASDATGGDEAQMTPTVEADGDASDATGGDEAQMTPTVEADGDASDATGGDMAGGQMVSGGGMNATLAVGSDIFSQAPCFTSATFPNTSVNNWDFRINDFWSNQNFTRTSAGYPGGVSNNPNLLSNLITLSLRGPSDVVIGSVDGFIVHPLTGKVTYVVATVDDMASLSDLSSRNQGADGASGMGGDADSGMGGDAAMPTATVEAGGDAAMPTATVEAGGDAAGGTETGQMTPTVEAGGDAAGATGGIAAGGTETGQMGNEQAQGSRTMLIPWGGIDLNGHPFPDNDPTTAVGARAFYLAMPPEMLANVPAFDAAGLGDDWEQGATAFWDDLNIPVTGGPALNQGNQQNNLSFMHIDGMDDIQIMTAGDGEGSTSLQVVDVILSPETGEFQYVILSGAGGMPMGSNNNQNQVSEMGTGDDAAGQGNMTTTNCLTIVPWAALTTNPTSAGAGTGGDAAGATGGDIQVTPTVEAGGDAAGGTETGQMTPTVEAGGDAAGATGGDDAGTDAGEGQMMGAASGPYTFYLSVSAERLAAAPCYASLSAIPNMTILGWDNAVRNFWGMSTIDLNAPATDDDDDEEDDNGGDTGGEGADDGDEGTDGDGTDGDGTDGDSDGGTDSDGTDGGDGTDGDADGDTGGDETDSGDGTDGDAGSDGG